MSLEPTKEDQKAQKVERRKQKMLEAKAQKAREDIQAEFRKVKKTLKQGSKNELINLVLNLMMEIADYKNALTQVFEENKQLKAQNPQEKEGLNATETK